MLKVTMTGAATIDLALYQVCGRDRPSALRTEEFGSGSFGRTSQFGRGHLRKGSASRRRVVGQLRHLPCALRSFVAPEVSREGPYFTRARKRPRGRRPWPLGYPK